MTAQRSAPCFSVQVQPPGKRERVDITDRITSFEYEDHEAKADLLKLTLRNDDLSLFEDPIIAQGNHVFVTWGYPGNMAPLRECLITKVKGATRITVEAQDKGVVLNRHTLSRTFENVTRSQVVEQIAREEGYDIDRIHVEATPHTYETITQARLTNAQFLKRLADLERFAFWVDFEGLHWCSRPYAQPPRKTYTYMLPPGVGDIVVFDIENDLTAKPAAVAVKARDPLEKTTVEGTADDSSTPRTTLATTPAVLVDEVTLERVVPPQTSKNAAVSTTTVPSTAPTAEAAQREADAKFTAASRVAVKLTATLIGDPTLAAKQIIELNLGNVKRISGKYYVKECSHQLGDSGYRCVIKASTDGGQGKKPADSAGKPNAEGASDAGGGGPKPRMAMIDEVTLERGQLK